MRRFAILIVTMAIVAGLTVGLEGIVMADQPTVPQSGPGKVSIGVDASEWSSFTVPELGIIPIEGSGQINGEFTIAERYGIQIGLRAQERFEGTLPATPNKNRKVGVYESETGFSSTTRAKWNYDWHVDLRGAKGVAAGKTLGDYDLTLETDIYAALFGFPVPVDLTFGGVIPDDTVLYQSSQNPDFGNSEFDAGVEGTYNFRMVLTPVTFGGPPISVAIQVIVTN